MSRAGAETARPLVVGHRGASAHAPENTLAAFERALDDGADGIEFDVRLASDGVPVVIHDATLRRTALRAGSVSAHTSDELARFDAGTWFNRRRPARARAEFAREGVPTLAETLRLFAPRLRVLYVELKCSPAEAPALAAAVVSIIREHERSVGRDEGHDGRDEKHNERDEKRVGRDEGRAETFGQSADEGEGRGGRIVIESFDLGAVAEVKRRAPHLRAAALFGRGLRQPLPLPARELIARARGCGADELALHRSLATPGRVEAARAAGLRTIVWTADHPAWAARAAELGLGAIITNDPARMLRALDALSDPRAGLR